MKKVIPIVIIAAVLLFFLANCFLLATVDFRGGYSVYRTGESQTTEYQSTMFSAMLTALKGDVEGMSFRFTGTDADIERLSDRLGLDILKIENTGSATLYYCHSSMLKSGVSLYGGNVNLQIAKRGGEITVGTPLILGSY